MDAGSSCSFVVYGIASIVPGKGVAIVQAGSEAGGDKRCGEATVSSAFISIYRATDNASMPYLNLVVYGIEGGKENAVTRLEKLFAEWREQNTANRSSQRFVVP